MGQGQLTGPDDSAGRYLSRGYQGAVFVTGTGADRVVVKRPMGGPVARRLRRAMLRREFRAYQRLAGLPGVPPCLGFRADGGLVLGYIDGEPYRESTAALRDRAAFFVELLAVIESCHRAGVAHADLKRRGNILIDTAGHPWVIDFGSAVLLQPGGGWLNRALFRQARRMDLNAWVKLKYRRRYDALSTADAPYYQPTVLEALARVVRRIWRKLTARNFRKAWRQRHR